MSPPEFSLLLFSVLISVAGQFLLKMGAIKLGKVHAGNFLNLILNIITIPELLLGLTCYGIGAVAYILLLTRVNLSVAAPAVSVGYIFSVLLGYFILKEPIPLIRLVGLSLIVTGVILVVWKK
ncbi:EamA family transporter [Sphaerospermopsis aphanizomenoides BCCUSP55]|uniref:EamA family transporter n=1 Tax=Sphaerospermopsis aphanizomenoides TaxID=459663 RepID=UPI000A74C991|nr:EamA family transporter [Sphaerospermopsis aphanizomenoides]MBK1987581.1 EamA family transporter [Sphaerospermopsis aphanizomenoides BCCUSP55]